MKTREHYEMLSALRYAHGALEHVKTGKTNNSRIICEFFRYRKRVARLSKPKKTRRVEQ